MTLGASLSQTLARIEEEKALKLAKEQQKLEERDARRRTQITWLVKDIQKHIETSIKAGKVPGKRVKNYEMKAWLTEAQKGQADNQSLYDVLIRWAAQENLTIVITYEHDGIGMESWLKVTAVPL